MGDVIEKYWCERCDGFVDKIYRYADCTVYYKFYESSGDYESTDDEIGDTHDEAYCQECGEEVEFREVKSKNRWRGGDVIRRIV